MQDTGGYGGPGLWDPVSVWTRVLSEYVKTFCLVKIPDQLVELLVGKRGKHLRFPIYLQL